MTGRDVGRAEPPLAYVELVLEDLTAAEPAWQANEQIGRQLTPAFLAAGLFLVVVAAGVPIMIRLQYPAPAIGGGGESAPVPAALLPALAGPASLWRQPRAVVDELVRAGLADPERLAVGRGLRAAGLATGLLGLAAAALVPPALGHLGPSPMAVPAGLLVGALVLALYGVRFPALSGAGARAAMLHSPRLRAKREP
jgi:hypothetical protein